MIMSMRLKKLLALSLSVSLVSTGIFVDVGMRSVTAVASKTKQAKDKKNVKKVKVTVAQKKTIKAPKSEKKVVWSIVSGQQNISVIKKDNGEIKIKAQKSGSVKLQAKQGKKKTIYNITVKKQAPKKSEIKQLTKFYKECFIKSSKEMGNDWYAEGDDFLHDKWIEWDDYGYIRGMSLEAKEILTEINLPRFKKIQYFGSVTGNNLKSIDLGNNPTLKYFFLDVGYGESAEEGNYPYLNRIDFSGCQNLEGVYINSVFNIKQIDLSNNRKIKTVNISHTPLDELKMPKTYCLKEFYMNWSRINELDLSNCTNIQKIGIIGCNPQSVTISLGNKTDKEISEFDIDVYSADVETSVRFVANREISEIPKVRYEYGYLGYIDGGLDFLRNCI
ncbi:hypothetical protein DWZ63_03670 [Clostridium sp. AF34-13]|jgi:hypothetical protein|uniref:BIG2 domain-containing protein n=2 Tax=Bacillota TaxID=1239 RepID=A0AAW3JRD7_9FIRM|nr:hypothetical protein APZ18_11590 [Butyribacter intestini]RHP26956.1 hypothetical protein DWZ63_03670 [Clostridium sp. AF34-13]RHU74603.1 hypothetical protein DXC30_11730 [Butyribacter intestini]